MEAIKYKLFFFIILEITSNTVYGNNCYQLSPQSLAKIHGQAFNSRYISIEPPKYNPDASSKRSSHEIPFYADNDTVSPGDSPAWETDHVNFYHVKKETNLETKTKYITNVFTDRRITNTNMFKARQWECSSEIEWRDLGVHYFPRYIRSVGCISKKCWYDHYSYKPKSLACIKISEKLQITTSEKFDSDYIELWVWEEIALNFCCDCVME